MIWRRRRALDDLDEDIREHLARETEENLAQGMSSEEADAAARRAFGSVTRVKEDTRAVWVPIWADQLAQDVRYAFRLVRRSPGFSCLVIATLALGIGLTTAVFSVVNAVLLRPLAYHDGDRLVWIVTYDDRVAPIKSIEVVSAPDFIAFHDHASTLERVVAFYIGMERVTAKDGVVATRVATVSSDFWDLAGGTPALGRLPVAGEDAILLSHAFFETAFNGDASVVGRMVTVNDRQVLLAGVVPRTFHPQLPAPAAVSQLPPGEVEAYHATTIQPPALTDLGVRLFYVIARTRPGVIVAQVNSELETLRADVRRAYPKLASAPRLRVTPFADVLVGQARRSLLILFGCVLVVLTIACVNIASLQLARASARRKEDAPSGRRGGPARGNLAAIGQTRPTPPSRYQAGPVAVHGRPAPVCQLHPGASARGLGGSRRDHLVAVQRRTRVALRGRRRERAPAPARAGTGGAAVDVTRGAAARRRRRPESLRRRRRLRHHARSATAAVTSRTRSSRQLTRARRGHRAGAWRDCSMSDPLMRRLAELPNAQLEPGRAERIRTACRACVVRDAPRTSGSTITSAPVWQLLVAVLGVAYWIEAIIEAVRAYRFS